MHPIRQALFAAVLLFSTPIHAQTQATREQIAEKMKPLHEANVKNMQEYTCNMALIHFERRSALDKMAGRAIPPSRYDSVIAKATECIGQQPTPLAYDYRAKAHADKGDMKAALADFEKATSLAKGGGSPVVPLGKIYEDRANLYMKLGDRAKAEADLREAAKLNPSEYSAKNKLENLDAEMAELRKKAAIADPKTAEDFIIAGTDHYNLGKYDKAVAAFDKSIALKPSAVAYEGKGKTLQAQNRPAAALAELNNALALAPKDADVLLWRGYVRRDLKRWDDAVADFTKAMSVDDGKQKAVLLNARGAAYTGKASYDAALRDHDAALAAAGADVYAKTTALNGKGDALRGQGKTAEALAAYNTAISTAGNDYFAKLNIYDAYLNRGRIYASQGKTDLAKTDFNEVLKMLPDSKDARAELARLSSPGNSGMPRPTAGAKTAETWAMEGRQAAGAQKWDEAVNAFTQCIRLAPDSAGGYAFRGAVLGMKGDMSGARADFDKALHLSKNNPAVIFMRGQMYAQLGKKPEAIRDFREVLRLVPGNPKATAALNALGEKP